MCTQIDKEQFHGISLKNEGYRLYMYMDECIKENFLKYSMEASAWRNSLLNYEVKLKCFVFGKENDSILMNGLINK